MYFKSGAEKKDFSELQNELRLQFSLREASRGGPKMDSGLASVMDDATRYASKSDEAARIAFVAAVELRKEVPKVVTSRLASSKDRASQIFVSPVTTGERLAKDVEELESLKPNEFAVKLRAAQMTASSGDLSKRKTLAVPNVLAKFGLVALFGVGLFVGGLVCLGLFFDARKRGRVAPIGFAAVEATAADSLMVRFGVYLVLFNAVGYALGRLLAGTVRESWTIVLVMSLTLILSAFFLRVKIQGRTDSFRSVIGPTAPMGRLVGLGLLSYVATVPFLVAALIAASALSKVLPQPSHPISQELLGAGPLDWVALVLATVVLAPVLEEFTFRGLLLPALGSAIKRPLYAMLLCGFLFAAIHPQGPLIWPALMAVGASSAYLRYWTGSLVPSVVLHMAHNGVIMLFALVLL